MRIVRVVVCALFVVSLALFGYVKATKSEDKSVPKIICDSPVLYMSVEDDESVLLSHVKAQDGKDGDLTKKVIIESTSAFISFGKVNVTFAVCDSNDNVSKLVVPVVYSDYKSPRIELLDDFVFATGKGVNIKDNIIVTDSLDGDITDRLIVLANGADLFNSGEYPLTLKITNSKSYTFTADIDLIMTEQLEDGYSVDLKEYLIYRKVGEAVDYNSYIKTASVPYNAAENYTITINSDEVDTTKAGTYNVFYYQKVGNEIKSMTRLIVIYEE